MKKATKGALAAAAAGSLLLGGAGSLAFWTGTGDVTGGSIKSGKLTLSAPVCNVGTDSATHDWQFDGGGAFAMNSSLIVPGDTITKICKMTLTLAGDHVGATLGVETPTITANAANTLDTELTPDATFTVGGVAYAPITAAGVYTILATVTVEFPDTVDTTTGQDVAAVLEDVTLTATQTHDA